MQLLLWKDLPKDQSSLLEQFNGQDQVVRENVERLSMGGHAASSFTSIVSGLQPPQTIHHDLDLLSKLANLAAPGSKVTLAQAVTSKEGQRLLTREQLVKNVKLSGLVNVSEAQEVTLDAEVKSEVRAHLKLDPEDEFEVVSLECFAPEFEIGSSRLLSFAKKVVKKPEAEEKAKNAVWGIDLDDDEVDLMDENQLLDEEDLAKPDPASLRVCGTTGKRKACKDCSCGLAEELDAGKAPSKKTVTSSCGSCYLGDAFRCASCPYLGMPAFKPGEKIALSQRQLNADA